MRDLAHVILAVVWLAFAVVYRHDRVSWTVGVVNCGIWAATA